MVRFTDLPWLVIPVPHGVELLSVPREKGTQGVVYTVRRADNPRECWVSQSIPALTRELEVHRGHKVCASSIFRILRGEVSNRETKGYTVDSILPHLKDRLERLNAFIAPFEAVVYVSRYPERWRTQWRTAPLPPPQSP
jgi:hypothetical protein